MSTGTLDDILCRLTTGYTRAELLHFPSEDTGLDSFDIVDELQSVDDAEAAIRALMERREQEARADQLRRFNNQKSIGVRDGMSAGNKMKIGTKVKHSFSQHYTGTIKRIRKDSDGYNYYVEWDNSDRDDWYKLESLARFL